MEIENINNTPTSPEENKQKIFTANGVKSDSFVKDNLWKVSVLVVFLNIFYPIGWHYKQWKAIKNNNEEYKKISPFWRGVFYPFYAFELIKILKALFEVKKNIDLQTITNEKELEEAKKIHKTSFAIWPFMIWASVIFLPIFYLSAASLEKLFGLIGFALIFWPISHLQGIINYILPKETEETTISFCDLLGAPFFALVLAFFMFGTFGGNSCGKINGQVFTNVCEQYSFTFPFKTEDFFILEEDGTYILQEQDKRIVGFSQVDLGDTPFTLEDIEKKFPNLSESSLSDKFSKEFNENTAHCFYTFHVIKKNNERKNIRNCFMQIKNDPDKTFHIIAETPLNELQQMPEFMTAFMNSYKPLKEGVSE